MIDIEKIKLEIIECLKLLNPNKIKHKGSHKGSRIRGRVIMITKN